MREKAAKPPIRFNVFTDDWEQRKLGELGEIVTGSTPSTTQSEYYSDDGIPWVTPTDINGNLICNTPKKLSDAGAEIGRVVPANTILCTCIASIGKNALLTVKGSFNQQINSLTPNKENDAYFLLTESELWSNTMKRMAASGTMQIVNKTEFSELQTKVPSLSEQKQIGLYFRSLDNLITLHQRKYEKLINVKKAMLEKMFPKNGSNVPEMRFKGFSGAWNQYQLQDIVQPYSDPVRTPDYGYFRLGIRSHGKGTFHSYVAPGMELETAQMHKVAANNLIVNITFAWEHAVAITNEADCGKLVSHRFPQFTFNDGMLPRFFKYAILDDKFRHHLWLSSPGGQAETEFSK